MPESMGESQVWADATFDVLKGRDIRHVVYVPDAGHARLIEHAQADPAIASVVLTTEEEGIGYLCGAWLGGDRGILLMQSSGVGNCINTLGLVQSGRFPFLTLVTMRGEWAEFNPWQVPMAQATQTCLEAMGAMIYRADEPDEVAEIVAAAADLAFAGDQPIAVLLSQRLIGRKVWTR